MSVQVKPCLFKLRSKITKILIDKWLELTLYSALSGPYGLQSTAILPHTHSHTDINCSLSTEPLLKKSKGLDTEMGVFEFNTKM